MLSVEASKVRGDHNRVKIRRNSWCIVFATMLVSKLRLQRGVSAFLAFPTRGSRQKFVSNLQISQDLAFQGDRVDPVFVQKFRSVLYSSSSSSLEATITYECIFDIQVPEGRCVGLQLADLPDDHPDALRAENFAGNNKTHWIYDRLHLDEVNYGVSLHNKNHRRSFWLGRLAMRHALLDQSKQPWDLSISGGSSCSSSILKDLHGRPQVPTGFLGSISHKRNTGVALVARIDNDSARSPPKVGIGVDIEESTTGERRSVARKVLTPFEQADLGRIPGVSIEEEVLLRFSLKESVYKAMHPLICQYVGFQEAEIQPLPDGSANVTLFLKSGAHKSFESVTAHWQRLGDFFLSTASVRLKEDEWSLRTRKDEGCHL